MSQYEMINIIDVNWEEGETAPAQKMISEEIVNTGGSLGDIGSMGRRKLAYPIDKKNEGLYLLSHFSHSPEGLVLLRDNLKLNPAIIRTLLLRYRGQPGITLEEEPEEVADASTVPPAGTEEESAPTESKPEEESTSTESKPEE